MLRSYPWGQMIQSEVAIMVFFVWSIAIAVYIMLIVNETAMAVSIVKTG